MQYRGVILFAMVCGRLPFGDDSQVKKQQKNGISFPSSRIISRSAKKLITGILNPSTKERFDTYDIILHDWTASQPVKAPQALGMKPKYSVDNCLSLSYHTTMEDKNHVLKQTTAAYRHDNPFAAEIGGVYGKRIASGIQQPSAPGPSGAGKSPIANRPA